MILIILCLVIWINLFKLIRKGALNVLVFPPSLIYGDPGFSYLINKKEAYVINSKSY